MGGGARHGCDPPHGAAALGADEEVTGVALSIGFGVTGRRLGIGRRVMGIEQPAAEGEVVAASAFDESAAAFSRLYRLRRPPPSTAMEDLRTPRRLNFHPLESDIVTFPLFC